MNKNISWPLVFLFSVIVAVLGALVWKGAVSSPVLTGVVGTILGYAINSGASAVIAAIKKSSAKSGESEAPAQKAEDKGNPPS